MNEPVDRVIAERDRLDAGFPGGFLISFVAHLLLAGVAFGAPLLFPAGPPLLVADGFVVVLPRGGGGAPQAPPAAEVPPATVPPATAPAAPEPPPKVLKPPKEEPRKGLPELDARKSSKKKVPDPPATRGKSEKASAGTTTAAPAQTPGLEFGPPGPGVPGGTDTGGDWYLASVQQKIWRLWNQQIKAGFTQPVSVVFTILADGSVTDVKIVQSSGATLLDLAAQRAVYSAAPFGPLPKDYGTNRKTIQANFKPTS